MIKRAERLHSLMPLLALLAFCGVFLLSSVVIAAERAAQGGGAPVFLVLPFQINEGSPLTKAADELPVTLAEQLNSRGIQTVSPATMMRLLQEQKVTTLDTRTSRSRRKWRTRMPRSKRPEQTRRKAMRSRCAGSILA